MTAVVTVVTVRPIKGLVTKTHLCEQLAKVVTRQQNGRRESNSRPYESQVQRPNHCTTKPQASYCYRYGIVGISDRFLTGSSYGKFGGKLAVVVKRRRATGKRKTDKQQPVRCRQRVVNIQYVCMSRTVCSEKMRGRLKLLGGTARSQPVGLVSDGDHQPGHVGVQLDRFQRHRRQLRLTDDELPLPLWKNPSSSSSSAGNTANLPIIIINIDSASISSYLLRGR